MKINLLKSDVYNKIAAGEVIEKPFNVVKELVENSIDAGASEIKIEIAGGGLDLIKISDNGSGIEKDDIANAFASHATSKIKTAEDLNNVLTLGFRGEALASIASVSKVTLITKTESDEIGTKVENVGGNIVSSIDVGCPTGTTFEVRDLFFNLPARKKFLKKNNLEEADITDFVEKLILSHPDISFSLIINDKTIYNFRSSNLENAIFTIYGNETYSNLIKVENSLKFFKGDEEIEITLFGFVGKPKIAKGSKKDQSLFINNRYVKNQTVYSAVMRAFDAYLMKGKYPFYALNLSIPANLIDVNVHPTKQEVRFENNSQIFDFVYRSVTKAILNAVSINKNDALASDEDIKIVDSRKKVVFEDIQKVSTKTENTLMDLFKDVKSDNVLNIASPKETDFAFEQAKLFDNKISNLSGKTESIKNEDFMENESVSASSIFENYKYLGRIFNTYLILEEGENVHFVDQHALHERLLYDKLCGEIENINNLPKQQFLVPIVKAFNATQAEVINANLNEFNELGICFEEFGKNTFKISEVPLILQDINIDKFLDDVFENSNLLLTFKSQTIIKDKLATMACKAAIKAGTPITEAEVHLMIDEAKRTGAIMQCPHGRPFVVSYSKKDIEKWFKRIV